MNRLLRWLACWSVLLLLIAHRAAGQQVNLLAWGDWGVDSPDRQQVADSMAAYAAKSAAPMDAALVLGDNFYVPLHSADDPAFQTLFEKTYDAKRMNFPFFCLLGNHDYEMLDGHVRYEWEMKYAATHPDSRFKLPAEWYRLDLPADHPLVTILLLDSDKEGVGKQGFMPASQWDDELRWINAQLSGPRAAWTICCAHHTVYSNGNKGDNGILVEDWAGLFKKYKVDFYLCGHDHTLQHLEVPGAFSSFVVSGGGGAKRDQMLRDNRGPFSRSEAGFAAFTITPGAADVRLLAENGSILHEFVRTKAGAVRIIQDSSSTPRVKDPLRAIQGIDDSIETQPAN